MGCMKRSLWGVLVLLAGLVAADTTTDQLIEAIASSQLLTVQENRAREQRFLARSEERSQLLAQALAEQAQLEQQSDLLEQQFEQNEITITNTKATLDDRLGTLKELFGVVQGATGDFNSALEFSLTNIELVGRQSFLTELNAKMAESTELPAVEELEQLWYLMAQEMTALGEVNNSLQAVASAAGAQTEQSITRLGAFNLISDQGYLQYLPDTRTVIELARQPQRSYVARAAAIVTAPAGIMPFAFDPTGASGGSLLAALIDTPSLTERIQQGGPVGYAIIAVGILGLLLALERFLALSNVKARVNWQLQHADAPAEKNPLGRVLLTYRDNLKEEFDALELKLQEAILSEAPRLMRNLGFIKIISAVAPLMGLLGTVTGMIITFQAITLFGTGDPKTMAGGISSALITTVLGLVVAIPLLLLHSLLNSQARGLVLVLEQQAAGLIAQRAEQQADVADRVSEKA